MYKPCVIDVDLLALENLSASDPDHPIVAKLSKISNKKEQTGVAMIKIVRLSKDCLHYMYAQYLGDETPDGKASIF